MLNFADVSMCQRLFGQVLRLNLRGFRFRSLRRRSLGQRQEDDAASNESSEGEAEIELFGEDAEINRAALGSGDFASAGIEDLVDESSGDGVTPPSVSNNSADGNTAIFVSVLVAVALVLCGTVAAVVFFMRRRQAASASAGGGGTTSKATNAAGPTGAGAYRYAPSGEDSDFGEIMDQPHGTRGGVKMLTTLSDDDFSGIEL